MLDKDPKKMASGVLARAFGEKSSFTDTPTPAAGGSSYADGGMVGEMGEMDEGKVMTAEEMMSAFHGKDAKKLAASMESFVEQCYGGESEESGE
jgi:hypothetical protein